jgi:CRP/FNR family cyclic AMP-dependent transcriptional regulator
MMNIELLQQTDLFHGFSQEDLELLSGSLKERKIKPNATIFAEKMPAEALYIIQSGSVSITIMAGEGEELDLLTLGPGEFFGELALVQEDVRAVNARAESAVELLQLTRGEFHALLEREPHIASRILMAITKLLVQRVKANRDHLKEVLLA